MHATARECIRDSELKFTDSHSELIKADESANDLTSRIKLSIEILESIELAKKSPRDSISEKRFPLDEFELFRDPDTPVTSQGTYMLRKRASKNLIGVFKPTAEEQAPMNARRKMSISNAVRQGIVLGDAAIKERAAFLLDFNNFAGVPRTETVLIETGDAVQRKGSLQEFCEHMCTSEDIGPSMYDKENIHAIALLDLRLFNLDRHVGNLLVKKLGKDKYQLVPIDHGLSLPSFRTLSDAVFCWSSWKQASLSISPSTKSYIASLKPFQDVVALKNIGLRDECILTYVLCTLLVQEFVQADRTLADIANIMQHELMDDAKQSPFEILVQESSREAQFDEFVFDDDKNTWSNENVHHFLAAFDRNIRLLSASQHTLALQLQLQMVEMDNPR